MMLTQSLHTGGLERMVLHLSTALKSEGEWQPQVFVYDRIPHAPPEDDLTAEFEKQGISVAIFPKPRGFSFSTAVRILRKIREDAVEVLHTHDTLIYGAIAKLLSFGRIRLIHTQHSFVHLTRRKIYKLYDRIFAWFADEIAVVSEDMKRTYIRLGVAERKIRVIPNGVRFSDKAVLNPGERRAHRQALLAKMKSAQREALEPFLDCRWLLYLARLHRVKGHIHALELWKRLSPEVRSKSVLLFVGPESEPGQLDRLRAGIAASPDPARLLYMGATRSPELWLRSAHLAISCSEIEGLPLGPIEAAGSGLPLVLSRIPGHEAVRNWSVQYPLDAPEHGALQVEMILEEIEKNPEQYYARLWKKTHAVRERFSLSRMSDAYSHLYHPS